MAMIRLNECLNIPGVTRSTRTATTDAYVSYTMDCQYAIDQAQTVLRGLIDGEVWEGFLEETLTEFEEWHARRKKEDWRRC